MNTLSNGDALRQFAEQVRDLEIIPPYMTEQARQLSGVKERAREALDAAGPNRIKDADGVIWVNSHGPMYDRLEPSAYLFELATGIRNGEYCGFEEHLRRELPSVPAGSIRNVRALYE